MPKSICIIQGHPYSDGKRLCHGIAENYAAAARAAGAKVRIVDVGALDFPCLRDPGLFSSPPPAAILSAQEAISASEHMTLIYPLWLGTMPALLKAFFEQLSRNAFAIGESEKGGWPRKMLKGRSARMIVTMGMPAAAYRLMFGAHGVKSFETGVLAMAGFKPVRTTLVGGVGKVSEKRAAAIFASVRSLGERDATYTRRHAAIKDRKP